MHVQVCTLYGCFCHASVHNCKHSPQGVHMRSCMRNFSISVGARGWPGGFSLSAGHWYLAWDVIFDTSKTKVLSVFSLFLTGVKVYVGVCVCIHKHTHTLHGGYSDVSPEVGTRHLQGPKNPNELIFIFVFVYEYKVHISIYMLRGGMRCWTIYFFS